MLNVSQQMPVFTCEHQRHELVENVYVCIDCGVVIGESLEDVEIQIEEHLSPIVTYPRRSMRPRPYGVAAYNLRENLDLSLGMDTAEIFHNMVEREMIKRAYTPNAKYIKWRRLLVDWMSEVGDELELHSTTIHVAVMYLDRCLQNKGQVARDKIQLVAICCIIIAAKFEEAEETVPSAEEMNEFASNGYTAQLIHQMEILVLNRLEWYLSAFTPLHFIGYFLGKGVLFEDDAMQGKQLVPKVSKYMKKYANFFADLTLQDYSFQQYKPSAVAVAIVVASRKALQISPLWRPELEALTGCCEQEVMPVFQHVWDYYKVNFPTNEETQVSPASTADLVV